jgi:hypothetical protein
MSGMLPLATDENRLYQLFKSVDQVRHPMSFCTLRFMDENGVGLPVSLNDAK